MLPRHRPAVTGVPRAPCPSPSGDRTPWVPATTGAQARSRPAGVSTARWAVGPQHPAQPRTPRPHLPRVRTRRLPLRRPLPQACQEVPYRLLHPRQLPGGRVHRAPVGRSVQPVSGERRGGQPCGARGQQGHAAFVCSDTRRRRRGTAAGREGDSRGSAQLRVPAGAGRPHAGGVCAKSCREDARGTCASDARRFRGLPDREGQPRRGRGTWSCQRPKAHARLSA